MAYGTQACGTHVSIAGVSARLRGAVPQRWRGWMGPLPCGTREETVCLLQPNVLVLVLGPWRSLAFVAGGGKCGCSPLGPIAAVRQALVSGSVVRAAI